MTSAAVVGSGPNGLAAALCLADAGLDVHVYEAEPTLGGGTRSAELTPGLIHDECSAAHPLALDNAFSRSFDLGIEWLWPDVQYSHPLDGGTGIDNQGHLELLNKLHLPWDELMEPVLHVPHHPLALGRMGALAALPATTFARRLLKTDAERALWGGVAAHSFRPLNSPFSSAVPIVLASAAIRFGWPVAKGGSQAVADAMAAAGEAQGVRFSTNTKVTSLDELEADVVMLNTSPRGAVQIAGDRLPPRIAHALSRFRYGPAAFKVDFAVHGGVPWTHEPTRRAGTVHVGGALEDIAAAEADTNAGRMPERPFVLVCQQYLADPSRSAGDLHPVWSYAHVPHGFSGDATEAIIAQIERFAPGFRERIAATRVRTVAQSEHHNANYVGGDIATGENDPVQLLLRPRPALDPYRLSDDLYLCSAATPPGAGAHGMCGYNAAQSALRRLAR
jgi:phytoene dehydrogenase-like protein